jgi:hypothetical protein
MPFWIWLLLAMAISKIAMGLLGFSLGSLFSSETATATISPLIPLVHTVVFSVVAGILIIAGRRDRRAVLLGVVFLLVASVFMDPLVAMLPEAAPSVLVAGVEALSLLQPDVFMPLLLWLFFLSFPKTISFGRGGTVARIGIRVSAVVGAAMFLLHAAPLLEPLVGGGSGLADLLSLMKGDTNAALYSWSLSIALIVPALVFAIWRARVAPVNERRRVGLFVAGLAGGFAPMLLALLLETLIPPFARLVNDPTARSIEAMVLHPFLLAVPVTTSYAVLVHHVLDVRLVIRKAIGYALARYSVLALAAIPFFGLAWYIYYHRGETISQLLSGMGFPVLIVAAVSGLVAIRARHKLINLIDLRFFREQYDSRRILSDLTEKSRDVANPRELAALLEDEIERALHLDTIAMLVIDDLTGDLRSPSTVVRPLSVTSSIARLVGGHADPLDVDLENPRSPLQRLAEVERQWLADGAFRLLVPLIASDGSLVGVLALGAKKSELPFTGEDILILSAVAASAALTLENRQMIVSLSGADRSAGTATDGEHRFEESPQSGAFAAECQRCGRIQPARSGNCRECGGDVESAMVPYILLGKFRFEERLGAGGMGVVYRAQDLALGRLVAIKTLPRVSPQFALQLRREARAMALVSHPNLSAIFGIETYHGTPLLIVEFLAGGTLSQRLRHGPLELLEAVDLAIVLAGVLERMHSSGVLHRDIKPSNIGYARDGSPKLLDLGLAKILDDGRRAGAWAGIDIDPGEIGTISVTAFQTLTLSRGVVGTLAYLSPEALRMESPGPSFDLWGLAVVLFESLTATHPFLAETVSETVQRIRRGEMLDIREPLPGCPEGVAAFIAEALNRNRGSRAASAKEFRRRLERLKMDLVPPENSSRTR